MCKQKMVHVQSQSNLSKLYILESFVFKQLKAANITDFNMVPIIGMRN